MTLVTMVKNTQETLKSTGVFKRYPCKTVSFRKYFFCCKNTLFVDRESSSHHNCQLPRYRHGTRKYLTKNSQLSEKWSENILNVTCFVFCRVWLCNCWDWIIAGFVKIAVLGLGLYCGFTWHNYRGEIRTGIRSREFIWRTIRFNIYV